jgi:DNA-binding transcriptional LysR family regulator
MNQRKRATAARGARRLASVGDPDEEALAAGGARSSPFLRSLEIFLAVQEHRGFSSAARYLGISQPTVTQRVQGLEESLGVDLFHRLQGEVKPTTAGRTLTMYAERLLSVRDEMMSELRGLSELKRGTLRLVASTTPGNYLMPPALQRFRERFGGVRLVMEIVDTEKVVERVRDGDAEIGVMGYAPTGNELESEPFVEDEIVVIASPGHPVLVRPEAKLEELAHYVWVTREPGSGTRKSVDAMLAQHSMGRSINVGLVLDSTEAIKLAVRAGAGIALVSRRAVENEVALGLLQYRRIAGEGLRRNFYLVRSRSRTLSPAGEALWGQLLGLDRITG